MRVIPDNCLIVDIRRGKGERANIVYARLVDKQGNLIIAATLDHITNELKNAQLGSIDAKEPWYGLESPFDRADSDTLLSEKED